MKRREVITLLGGAAAAPSLLWPLAARAQQVNAPLRIGYVTNASEGDAEAQARNAAFRNALEKLGWVDGRNIRIEYRWNVDSSEQMRASATELVALAPKAILVTGSPNLQALTRQTRSVPIVFVAVSDPLITGLVQSMARPGGNVTGFTNFEFPIAGKWLEMLKEVAPGIRRVLVLSNPDNVGNVGVRRAVEAAAPVLGVARVVGASPALGAAEIERAISEFAREPSGGLIVPPGTQAMENRDLIVGLAARLRLPAIYAVRPYIVSGGLMSYDTDAPEMYRRAASYIDRILKGEQPADLPVQAPTKFELVINLKVAKALGLTIPLPLLARADEVIE